MTLFKRITWIAIALLAGCAGPGYFEPIQPTHDNEAVLYLYRPKADNPGLQPLRFSYPDMLLDNQSVGILDFNRHRAVRVAPGAHSLTATGLSKLSKWEPKDRDLTFTVEPGEIKYIKLNVRYDRKKMTLGHPGPKYLIHLTPMSAESAIYEIRDTEEQDE